MNFYEQKTKWKLVLMGIAIGIVGATLLYTSYLAHHLEVQEHQRIQLVADATREMATLPVNPDGSSECSDFLWTIMQNNTTIPLILTDEEGNIFNSRNLDDARIATDKDSSYLKKQLEKMKAYPPVVIDLALYDDIELDEEGFMPEDVNIRQYMYYSDSWMLRQLKIYPFIQLGIISLFLALGYIAFSAARRAEQDKVWLGMAKETAHQLGTPLFSLVGWIELLKDADDPTGTSQMVGIEIEKDIGRLKLIADRFSKIGSQPKMEQANIIQAVLKTMHYVKRRAPKKVFFSFDSNKEVIDLSINPILFDWVIENLLKNALDAMEGKGNIDIAVNQVDDKVIIDVTDTGKGIPRSKHKTVFEPGFSTKKRGWGLGLSLSKRIVEIYHLGKISVHQSAPGQGTQFRIVLPLETETKIETSFWTKLSRQLFG